MKKTELIAKINAAVDKIDKIPSTPPASDEADQGIVDAFLVLDQKLDARIPSTPTLPTTGDGTTVDVKDDL